MSTHKMTSMTRLQTILAEFKHAHPIREGRLSLEDIKRKEDITSPFVLDDLNFIHT